jgi:coenzyme F420-reducing hydrogenase delta subunit
LTWIAASDGVLLAETLQDMVAQIKGLGPSQAKLQEVV